MKNETKLEIFIFAMLLFLSAIGHAEEKPTLVYQSTGSTPLQYRGTYRWTRAERLKTSLIHLESDQPEEKNEGTLQSRTLATSQSLMRYPDEGHPGEIGTKLVSIIQKEKVSSGLTPLATQMIGQFFTSTSGNPDEAFSLEALPYLVIPLPLPPTDVGTITAGREWDASWKLRENEGDEKIMMGHYRIGKIEILAGHPCVFIDYRLTSPNSINGESWSGEGSFAFDDRRGYVISHHGKIKRVVTREDFKNIGRDSAKVSQEVETNYDFAQVLVP